MTSADGFGSVVAAGLNAYSQSNVPDQPVGAQYVAVAAGGAQTVLLRKDGVAVAVGCNNHGRCDVSDLPVGAEYFAVAAGSDGRLRRTVLLRSAAIVTRGNGQHNGGGAQVVAWRPEFHQRFPRSSRAVVTTLLLVGVRRRNENVMIPLSALLCYVLPFAVLAILAPRFSFAPPETRPTMQTKQAKSDSHRVLA